MTKWKRNNYKFWHSPIALIVLFLVFVLFGYSIIDLVKKDQETAHKKELILDQIDSLKKKEASLSSNIARLKTDEGKEEIIREKYQVAKEGEKMIIIVDEDRKEKPIEQEVVSHGFWNSIKKIFKL